MEEVKTRNSNIEILRIVLMAMVILLHFNGMCGDAFTITKDYKANYTLLMFLESVSIVAVDCFMIISGYFLANNKTIKFGKIVDLYLVVVLYNFVNFFINTFILKNGFSKISLLMCFLPLNYFFIFYSVIYIFSPFVSVLFNNLNKKQMNIFLILLFLIFVAWSCLLDTASELSHKNFSALSTVSSDGSSLGYSIVNFFVCFCIGAFLRFNTVRIKTWNLLLIYIFNCLLTTVLSNKFYYLLTSYCSVFTVVDATILFILFSRINIDNKIINFISKSVFAVFCLHTQSSVGILFREHIVNKVDLTGNMLITLLYTLFCVLSLYIICIFVDICFRFALGKLSKKLTSKIFYINLK